MIVRAPTAADALTIFSVNYGEPADRVVTEMGLLEAIDVKLVNCPICFRTWGHHHSASPDLCLFRNGWVMVSRLDAVERSLFGLPPIKE